MMTFITRSWQGKLLPAMAIAATFWIAGCDRFMLCHVDAYVLDAKGEPLSGEVVGVIPSGQHVWPTPAERQGKTTPIDLARYGRAYETDANGLVQFEAVNMEPVGFLDLLIVDMFVPPSIQFLIMLPDKEPSAYGVTFVPPRGGYGRDRLTYRHLDLKTGRTLPTSYSDASGGLDIAIHRLPKDPNNPWKSSPPRLDIRILTREKSSAGGS
jgi:hypothetical protein